MVLRCIIAHLSSILIRDRADRLLLFREIYFEVPHLNILGKNDLQVLALLKQRSNTSRHHSLL